MAKSKYRFNPDSLGYDKIKISIRRTLVRIFTLFTATLAIAVVYYFIYSGFFETPKERILSREINQMTANYQTLTENLQRIEDVLADIQQRDENLYRTIFEAEPVPNTIRRAGIGGVNRYEMLENYSNSEIMIETSKRADALLRQLKVQSKLFDDLLAKAKEKEEQMKTRPAIQPVENKDLKRTAASYGWRMHPIYRTKRFHEGMDFMAPAGTPVIATGDGEVVALATLGAQGLKITVDHGYGYQTVYAHMEGFSVKKGAKVARGQVIGRVGNSGMSIAPHLHYEVHKDGKPVNPIDYYYNELSPVGYAQIKELANIGKTFD
jgi:murein DD-endopeptidase MepM/ murein hydrolase activator NlpD